MLQDLVGGFHPHCSNIKAKLANQQNDTTANLQTMESLGGCVVQLYGAGGIWIYTQGAIYWQCSSDCFGEVALVTKIEKE